MENFKNTLNRLPILLLACAYCGWLAYDYYDWLNSPTSELGAKKTALATAKTDLATLDKKLAVGEEFFRNLDDIRTRIRALSGQLDSTKALIGADIDVGAFVRIITLEAQKLGIIVKSFKPASPAEVTKENYVEVPYTVTLRGAYVQMLVFFDRIAKLQQIVRISGFGMKPTGNIYAKYVELEGTVKLVAYRYVGNAVDEILKKDSMKDKEKAEWGK